MCHFTPFVRSTVGVRVRTFLEMWVFITFILIQCGKTEDDSSLVLQGIRRFSLRCFINHKMDDVTVNKFRHEFSGKINVESYIKRLLFVIF